jgi:predicted GH43/DUF377 family glycosyl hydrolase/CheY-like chemotaxis protein
MPINIIRQKIKFFPNPERVIFLHYLPGNKNQTKNIIKKILKMTDHEAKTLFDYILRNFSPRFRNITRIFENSFNNLKPILTELKIDENTLSSEKKIIIGVYFTKEYSVESTAFFNPSIVDDPYQGDLKSGQKRIIVSFRATGEGHISSIAFRSGIIDEYNNLSFVSPGDLVDLPEIVTRYNYHKEIFLHKLAEMNIKKDVVSMVMDQLSDEFTYGELQAAISNTKKKELSYTRQKVIESINWLATSHYEVAFSLDTAISERILYPVSYTEKNGIEDARFVKFTDDDGSITYYGTYTAYNGFTILPKLMVTKNFCHFQVEPLHGEYAQNKGMALFPRKINGKYAMLSRIDGINNYIMFSHDIHLWQNAKIIQEPLYPWELVKIGNAGSPIETEHGWLVITHGVGPMRTYTLGAILLDLNDPTKLIGRLQEPLLVPNSEERVGYVPNVVYSCGSIIHNDELIIAYGMSDYSSGFAVVPLNELMYALLPESFRKKYKPVSEKQVSILVVEDDPNVQKIIHRFLTEEGHEITLASDGIDALMRVGKHKFDLIVSDILMPNLNGIQLLEQLNQKGVRIPVMFITGYHNLEYELKSKELGAVGYIKKPINKDVLIKKVHQLIDFAL